MVALLPYLTALSALSTVSSGLWWNRKTTATATATSSTEPQSSAIYLITEKEDVTCLDDTCVSNNTVFTALERNEWVVKSNVTYGLDGNVVRHDEPKKESSVKTSASASFESSQDSFEAMTTSGEFSASISAWPKLFQKGCADALTCAEPFTGTSAWLKLFQDGFRTILKAAESSTGTLASSTSSWDGFNGDSYVGGGFY